MRNSFQTALANRPSYKYWAFGAISVGTIGSVIDHGSTNVALPTIAGHFNTDIPTVQWVVLAYVLTITALLLPMGKLADMVGRKKIYIIGSLVFAIGAGVSGSAGSGSSRARNQPVFSARPLTRVGPKPGLVNQAY